MKQVNVTTLRQNLPDYLAMVVEGETLSVTLPGDNGRNGCFGEPNRTTKTLSGGRTTPASCLLQTADCRLSLLALRSIR